MKRLNVCMLTSSYPKYPGETTAPFIEEIAAGLVRRGHTIHVVAPYHREVRRAPVERGVHLHFFRYSPCRALNVWGYAESTWADVKIRRRVFAALPLALTAAVTTMLRVAGEAARQGQPFDLLHAHWVLPNAPPVALVARLHGLPLVISLHGSDVYLAERAVPLTLAAAGSFRSARVITACSRDLQERALRIGARPGSVKVIPYGVDPEAFRPDPQARQQVCAELGLPPETPLIVTMSRLVYKKGLTYLLEAFPHIRARHPNVALIIGGYGDLREELEHRAADLGVAEHVHFPGQLARDRAARYVAAADVYAVPSIHDQGGNVDGLPNALLEGMGAGRPIVASRVAGIPEVITDGENGLLVPERDALALASAIARLLDEPALAHRLGAAARQCIVERLTWNATAAHFEDAYHHALAAGT